MQPRTAELRAQCVPCRWPSFGEWELSSARDDVQLSFPRTGTRIRVSPRGNGWYDLNSGTVYSHDKLPQGRPLGAPPEHLTALFDAVDALGDATYHDPLVPFDLPHAETLPVQSYYFYTHGPYLVLLPVMGRAQQLRYVRARELLVMQPFTSALVARNREGGVSSRVSPRTATFCACARARAPV